MRVKDWKRFQHFKDRKPPWIKLYGDLLDDPDWHELDPFDAKTLVMIWLVARDDDQKKGNLPGLKKLAFRLRITCDDLAKSLRNLIHWIEGVDTELISNGYQKDTPETETETETEEQIHSAPVAAEQDQEEKYKSKKGRIMKGQTLIDFKLFWKTFAYPKGKAEAADAWLNVYSPAILNDILEGAKREAEARPALKAKNRTPKMAQGWLSGRRWEDGGEDDLPNCEICGHRKHGYCKETREKCHNYSPVN